MNTTRKPPSSIWGIARYQELRGTVSKDRTMLHIDHQYTPEELTADYARRARTAFDNHQRLRTRFSRLNTGLLYSVAILGVLAVRYPWCGVALMLVSIVLLISGLNQKTVSHALSAMTCLRHAQTFEHLTDFTALPRAIESFEVDTLHN
jgi:hypothetical protein